MSYREPLAYSPLFSSRANRLSITVVLLFALISTITLLGLTMTQLEYQTKRNALALSEAPLADRVAAIEALDQEYAIPEATKVAHEQFQASRADLPTGGE